MEEKQLPHSSPSYRIMRSKKLSESIPHLSHLPSASCELEGKVALVSGGARGIGESHVRAIVEAGGSVVIGDVRIEEARTLAAAIGPRASAVELDVTSLSSWEAAVRHTVTMFGRLNVLVNNAGIINYGPLGRYSLTDWNLVMAVNATGTFLGLTAARDALVEHAPSSVVNISSDAGFKGAAGLHGYGASKWAVRGLTKSAATELGPLGVRVNSIHPGIVKTPMTEGIDLSPYIGPLGRAGEPEDISNFVVFLASDRSSFATGSEFLVDGGNFYSSPLMEEQ